MQWLLVMVFDAPAALTAEDLARAARALDCEVALIKAVSEVESSGSGFLPSGKPKILSRRMSSRA